MLELLLQSPSRSTVLQYSYPEGDGACNRSLTTMGTMPTEYMGGLMAAIHSFLLSCCSSAANVGPSAVETTNAGPARAWGMPHLNMPMEQSHVPLTWLRQTYKYSEFPGCPLGTDWAIIHNG
jgi:hypothetical protein